MSDRTTITLQDYSFFPYELDLAEREVRALVGGNFEIEGNEFKIGKHGKLENLWRLTYFSEISKNNLQSQTLQHQMEKAHLLSLGRNHRRQATRYSVHGLHEYKGKFNPQLAHALLNIFGADSSHRVLDPFCGSGTTLVEAAHLGISGTGMDLNPFAVFLANTKFAALTIDVSELRAAFRKSLKRIRARKPVKLIRDERIEYLEKWFDPAILETMESLLRELKELPDDIRAFLQVAASDILRDYSLQEPADLRIRRRKTPLPSIPFIDAWERATEIKMAMIEETQPLISGKSRGTKAFLSDVREVGSASTKNVTSKGPFDFVITSPPYATALPYIDTQRLSLVWLGLIPPEEIRGLEAGVLGSREIAGGKNFWMNSIKSNSEEIPDNAAEFCTRLTMALKSTDGFRRQAVPVLLYRYLAGMKSAFGGLHKTLKKGGRMAWVVGVNQTTLGGKPIVIDTPELLVQMAEQAGFKSEKHIELQTYQRYGLHQKNAIRAETVLMFKK